MNPSPQTDDATAAPLRAAFISARIDRLPAVATIWRLVALLSIAGFFELYDLFQTAYISPGLVRDGIFATGSQGLFGFSDQAAFASATFLGLFFGASLLSPIADRYGRRAIFTFALIWYTVATVIMGLQTSALGVIGMRFIVGIGLGVELVTIDTYLSELVPKRIRSSAFAFAFFYPVFIGPQRCADVVVAGASGTVRFFWLALGGDRQCRVRPVCLVAALGAAGITSLAGAAGPLRRSRTDHGWH